MFVGLCSRQYLMMIMTCEGDHQTLIAAALHNIPQEHKKENNLPFHDIARQLLQLAGLHGQIGGLSRFMYVLMAYLCMYVCFISLHVPIVQHESRGGRSLYSEFLSNKSGLDWD